VRYQNRYLGWMACHELLKHIPHALAHLIAAKPSQEQPNEVSLVFWTGVFLSPGRRICVIGKETGPGPGGYG